MDCNNVANLDYETLKERVILATWNSYHDKIEPYKEQVYPIEKRMVLSVFDRNWMEHIDAMRKLRDGISLRSYAQGNPLQAYIEDGFEMFESMVVSISREVVQFCLNVQVRFEDEPNQAQPVTTNQPAQAPRPQPAPLAQPVPAPAQTQTIKPSKISSKKRKKKKRK